MSEKRTGRKEIRKAKNRLGQKPGQKLNQWSEDRMKGAIMEYREQVETGQAPQLRMIARAWNVPKSTLQRRVKNHVQGYKHASGRKPVLPKESEAELVKMIKTLSKRGFPLRRKEIQLLAYQYAQANNLPGFSEKKKRAEQYWFENFMRRNPDLSQRKPEALSAARAAGINPTAIEKWFQQYQDLLTELGIKDVPSHIWNCDETGMQDHFLSATVISEVGSACYEITSGEKGETTTALASFNAAGDYGPLLVIFKAKRLKAKWLYNVTPNTVVKVSDNGWITTELFLDWGKQFVDMLPKDDLRPHVLLLDGHTSHVFNIDFLRLMQSHRVHVVCYPSHTTHCLQPADKSLFKSLKHHWNEEGRSFMRLTGGRKLLKGEFFSLFGRAWRRASTVQTAQAGFRGTGMYPVNPMAIHPNVYEPSLTTERPLEPEGSAQEHENLDLPEIPDRIGAEVAVGEDATNTGQEEVLEGVSFATLIPIPKRERGK